MMISKDFYQCRTLKPSMRGPISHFLWTAILLSVTGCTSLLSPLHGTAVSRLPPELLARPRSNYVNVPVVMLAVPPVDDYRLDEGDVLGLYLESVLPFNTPASPPSPPPVNFPDGTSSLPPSIGFPIAVQAKGIINLPIIKPLNVKGMTIAQAQTLIHETYLASEVLKSRATLPILTLIKERTYNITVVRESGGVGQAGASGTAMGQALKLPAYQNDVLHALTSTGGLPGFNEKNEVTIFKTSRIPYERRAELMMQVASGDLSCMCGGGLTSPLGASPLSPALGSEDWAAGESWVIQIPLRVPPGQVPQINPGDVELHEGDIVYVQSRETEFFFTGGLLSGGQFPLPRDYDLGVLGALALAGKGQGGGGGGGGGGGFGGFGGTTPTQLFVIRKLPCGRTYNIAVDLQLALNDSTQDILVQPGDTLILRYKPHEEMLNFGLGTFFTFGIAQLFNGGNNN